MSDRHSRTSRDVIPDLNTVFMGEVVSLKDYGAFVKIPGCYKNGLIHKSQMSRHRVDDVGDVVNMRDRVWCKVISLGETGDKISLSMKVVNQRTGEDLDPNGVEIGLDEKRRMSFTPYSHAKITLEAVYNTVCKKCGIKGHMSKDCFQIPGGKNYDLLPDDDPKEQDSTSNEMTGEKKVEHKLKLHKRRHHSSSDEEAGSSRHTKERRDSFEEEDSKKHKLSRHNK